MSTGVPGKVMWAVVFRHACGLAGWCKTDLAGWEDPPLSAEDGSQVVVQVALSATLKEHGRHIVEGRDIRIPSKL